MGEAFSRGLDQTISGSNDWVSCQIPFFLKKGERPDLVRLNVVIEGEGEVYARDIELHAAARPAAAAVDFTSHPAPLPLSDEDAVARLIEEAGQLLNAQRMVEAGVKYAEAVRRAPNNADAWSGLGWATLNANKVTEAQRAFERALALDPDHHAALNGLGNTLAEQHEYAKAEAPLLKSAERSSPVAWFLLAKIYLLQGRFEEALKWANMIEDTGQADEMTKKIIEAAKTKQLSEGLRLLLGGPPTKGTKEKTPPAER
jgi:tetratricopeptide (TPR) repeat protein